MHKHRIGATAHKARSAWVMWAGMGMASVAVVGGGGAWAQAAAPAGDAPSEALRRQALSPYRFILQNANAPSRKPAPAPAEPKEAKRSAAPAAVEQAAVQPRANPPVAAKALPAAPAPVAAQPAPEPVATLSPKPAEPAAVSAVRREIVPIRTDEPQLPAALLREKPSGVVRVSFEVMPDGSTAAVKVVASTNRSLNRASVDAVSRWKFEPVDEAQLVETELAYKYE